MRKRSWTISILFILVHFMLQRIVSSILVLSDSHGSIDSLTAVLRWAVNPQKGEPAHGVLKMAVFLGDGTDDLGPASQAAGFALPWYCVRGNGDHDLRLPDTMLIDAVPPDAKNAGRRLFLTHGNHYHVDAGFGTLAAAAQKAGAEAALFGHIHAPVWKMSGDVWLLNPGSIGRPRTSKEGTFAVLEIPQENGRLVVRFFLLKETRRGITIGDFTLP
jgi:putative phosphoesterase